VQGIAQAISFASLVGVGWGIPLIPLAIATFVGTGLFGAPLLPLEFSHGFVGSAGVVLGTTVLWALLLLVVDAQVATAAGV